jgi:hypothetical protein
LAQVFSSHPQMKFWPFAPQTLPAAQPPHSIEPSHPSGNEPHSIRMPREAKSPITCSQVLGTHPGSFES